MNTKTDKQPETAVRCTSVVGDTSGITREGITVEAGQVWRDLDKRCGGRIRTVIEVKDGKALMDGPKRVRVAVRRMHRHSTGWSLVSPTAELCGSAAKSKGTQ